MMEGMPNCIEHCMVGLLALTPLIPAFAYSFKNKSPSLSIVLTLLVLGAGTSAEQDMSPCEEQIYNTQIELDDYQTEETGKVSDTQEEI